MCLSNMARSYLLKHDMSLEKFCQGNQRDYQRFNQAHVIEIPTEATHQTSGKTAVAVQSFGKKKTKVVYLKCI